MFQNNYFEGKIALITGSGQGIGREIALTLARAGCYVLVNDLNEKNAQKTCHLIHSEGHKSDSFVYDVSKESEVKKMLEEILSRFKKVDILVNNVGIIATRPLLETSTEEWNKVMQVNLKSTFLTIKYIGANMCQRKFGRIINISSIAAKTGGGFFGNSVYATSKAGVIALTKGAAREFGPHNINVNAITPGNIKTKMTQRMTDEQLENVLLKVPLSRSGRTQDVANAVYFLASPLSDYITGEIIDIDGGLTMN